MRPLLIGSELLSEEGLEMKKGDSDWYCYIISSRAVLLSVRNAQSVSRGSNARATYLLPRARPVLHAVPCLFGDLHVNGPLGIRAGVARPLERAGLGVVRLGGLLLVGHAAHRARRRVSVRGRGRVNGVHGTMASQILKVAHLTALHTAAATG